jgi:molecular chaperone Hsp33
MSGDEAADDSVQPFRVGAMGAKGRHVRLGASIDRVLSQHAYPDPVSILLGEFMALTATLASVIKYDGVFIVQASGDGPIRMVVADITSDGVVRGYADFDEEAIAALALDASIEGSVPRMLGAGHPALGATLSDCAHDYFRQSEQIETGIALACGRTAAGWRSGAIMLQRVPHEGGTDGRPAAFRDEFLALGDEDDWRRFIILMSSVKTAELLDPTLESAQLLHRLFHEEDVWLYPARTIAFGCRCSRARVTTMLKSFPRDEIDTMKIDGRVVVTCQFCNQSEVFEDDQLDAVYQA